MSGREERRRAAQELARAVVGEAELHWQDRAACRGVDPDLFFPERGASLAQARAVCAECPVRQACLDYALEAGEKWGVWGGLSERERRQLRRARFGTDLDNRERYKAARLRLVAS